MKEKPALRLGIDLFRFYGLILRYCYLRVCYVYLLIKYHLVKVAGAALIEAVEIWYSIKLMSNEYRVIFATCIAVSIFILARFMLIRI